MALRKNVTLTIFDCEPYEFTGSDGQTRSGFNLKGFDNAGVVHSFTSEREASKVYDVGGYDADRVQDFILDGRIWNDKTKWREVTK